MPFGSYQESPAQAFRSAARVMAETGCGGIKLEGGIEMAETVAFLTGRGIPVMGHVGLTPQSVNSLGGYRSRGHDEAEAARILADAQAIADSGAFSMVIEGTVEPLARRITQAIAIPTIGIGASPACDGQILVTDDMIGLFAEFTPKFVKRYAELGTAIAAAAEAYAADVRARRFPGPEHCFGMGAERSLKAV
jgi:3-methyl-2-oxobutanoate hydroxymethyltransferase